MSPMLLLRWSLRDLRRKWVQVAAIALVIAVGTGLSSALSSTAVWRRESNDASFAATGMYDLRVRATEGAFAAEGSLLAVLQGLDDPSVVLAAEERLVVETQVDASRPGETIRVPGRIIGLDLADGGPHLTSVAIADGDGRRLTSADDGDATVLLERNFADFYDLPPAGTLRLAGGLEAAYVGTGMAPEYFFVTTDDGGFFAQANFAVVFAGLQSAQALAGHEGEVNDLVLALRPGFTEADATAVQAELGTLFEESGLGLGATVMTRDDEDAYRILYDDIEGDQKFWDVFSLLILAGAAFGAFNLASRMVEAQRREIGIAMALGASRLQLAVRPMLVGLEIAIAGVLLGVGVGMLAIAGLRPTYTTMLPLPVWITRFQPGMFVGGAVVGCVIPLLATAWPVWRAVRVRPIDAITTVHHNPRSGLSRLLRRLPWPRSAFRRMPLGNVLRTPRRTLLTALGTGAAIATLVATLGMIDSFMATLDRNDAHVLGEHPGRMVVGLDGFVGEAGPEVAAVAAAESVGEVSPVLVVGGSIRAAGSSPEAGFDVLIEAVDTSSDVWTPLLLRGEATGGVVLSSLAADDLGADVGDDVVLTHPARDGLGFTMVDSTVLVAGVHGSPFRFNVYVDRTLLPLFGAEGLANQLSVLPAAGGGEDEVEAELFGLDRVTSVQPVATASTLVRDTLDQFTAVLRVMEGFILLLALLIAYNATSINADERARERATLFAFGLPVRRVMWLEMAEGLLLGVVGTAFGVAAGAVVLRWLTTSVLASTMPDMALDVVLSGTTVATAVVLGVVAVAVAPLLTLRKLRRMDVPGTLRVVE